MTNIFVKTVRKLTPRKDLDRYQMCMGLLRDKSNPPKYELLEWDQTKGGRYTILTPSGEIIKEVKGIDTLAAVYLSRIMELSK